MNRVQLKSWYQHFKLGQETVESYPCFERPPENVEHIQDAIKRNWQVTVQELKDLEIPGTVHKIFSHFEDLVCSFFIFCLAKNLHTSHHPDLIDFPKLKITTESEDISDYRLNWECDHPPLEMVLKSEKYSEILKKL